MSKIIVTGGYGFIGSCLIRKLIAETDHEIVNIDKKTYAANETSLASVQGNPRYRLYLADICDVINMATIFAIEKPDAIFHLAAESHVDRSITAPSDFLQTNIFGTYALLQVALEYFKGHKPENFRFIHISTDEVYGHLPIYASEEDNYANRFNEKSPYQPNSPYSASKASSDLLVRAWHKTYGLPTIITHCSNNYGPYQFPEKLIPQTILNFHERKPVPVYGNGKNIRDWVHVEDHCDALLAVWKNGRVGETYDIGGNCERTNISVVNAIGAMICEDYDKYIAFVTDRPGHDLRYAIDTSKILNELNWTPKIPFETGLEKTVTWYLGTERTRNGQGI